MSSADAPEPASATPPKNARVSGVGRVLIVCYGVLALAATGRSFVQIAQRFAEAPLAYSLSALAALVYIAATIALVRGRSARRLAWLTIGFELAGVLAIGTVSQFFPELFPRDTVWSHYGSGYLFIPLVLPVLGMLWLRRQDRSASGASA